MSWDLFVNIGHYLSSYWWHISVSTDFMRFSKTVPKNQMLCKIFRMIFFYIPSPSPSMFIIVNGAEFILSVKQSVTIYIIFKLWGWRTGRWYVLTDLKAQQSENISHCEQQFWLVSTPISSYLSQWKIITVLSNYVPNKTVLLRERKRHTARRAASARSAVLSWGGGGTPVLARGSPCWD